MTSRADIMAFIDANSRGFHDAMKRVRSDSKNTASTAQRDFAKLSDGMTRSMNFLKASLAGIGVGLSLQGAKEIIGDVAAIDREAKRAGLSIQALQEMKFVAQKNRIEVDAMIDGLKELSLRADEFATTGKGSAAEAFQRLGLGAKDVEEKLKKPSELFIEIIGRVQQLNKAAQIRVMDELFGGSAGERFVELIGKGEEGIRQVIAEAHELGIVIEEDLVRQAAELDEAFNTVVTTVSQSLKLAIVSAATELKFFLDLLNKTENRSLSTLERELKDKKNFRAIMDENSIRGSLARGHDGGRKAVIDEEIAALEQQIALIKERNELNKPDDEIKLKPIVIDNKPGRSGSSRKEAISEAEKQKKAADELIQSLEHEYQMLGKTSSEQRIATELRKLSVGATDEQKASIQHLITAIEAQSKAQEMANKRQQQFIDGVNQLESDTVDALGQVITGTENASDAFKKLAIEIVKSAITGKGAYADFFQGLFGGSGGGGGFGNVLGGLLGFGGQKSIAMNGGIGLYAKGGISDVPAVFGEAGPEAAVPLPDGRSIPVDLRMSALPSLQPSHHDNNQSATVFTFAPVIHAPNADKEGLLRVEQRLERMQRELPSTVIQTVREAQNGNVSLG